MGALLSFPVKSGAPGQSQAPMHVPLPVLETQFPHVCVELTRLWQTHDIEPYLQSLIIDERMDRNGFPAEAFDELLFLADISRVIQHGYARLEVADPESIGMGVTIKPDEEQPPYVAEEDPLNLNWNGKSES